MYVNYIWSKKQELIKQIKREKQKANELINEERASEVVITIPKKLMTSNNPNIILLIMT
ncbi:hypothetical protein GCM10011607_21540 [Shewanella inventionis]|uniref:Uncharacterized protein n=1 Tax=Shewanella inventionis TaxID=1738770 RepID=A0ABQ1J7G6_9GAMM|nr:hypothetical protein GCM10011607_21540 [Shewanella inventionis]